MFRNSNKFVIYQVLILTLFNLIGIVINLVLKSLTRTYRFQYPKMIFQFQVIGIFLFSSIYLQIKYIRNISKRNILQVYIDNIRNFKKVYLLTILMLLNGYLQIGAISVVSIPILLAAKRSQVLFVIIMKIMKCQSRQITFSMVFSSILITASAIFAIQGDIENQTVIGNLFILGSIMATILNTEVSGDIQKKYRIGQFELLNQNTMFGLIPLVLVNYFTDTNKEVYNFIVEQTPNNQLIIFLLIILFIVMIFFHQYLLYLSAKDTSTFAIAISGNFKDLVATIVSITMYDDINLSKQVIISLTFSFMAVIGYTIFKFYEQTKSQLKDSKERKLIEHNYSNTKSTNEYNKIQLVTSEERDKK